MDEAVIGEDFLLRRLEVQRGGSTGQIVLEAEQLGGLPATAMPGQGDLRERVPIRVMVLQADSQAFRIIRSPASSQIDVAAIARLQRPDPYRMSP